MKSAIQSSPSYMFVGVLATPLQTVNINKVQHEKIVTCEKCNRRRMQNENIATCKSATRNSAIHKKSATLKQV